MELGMRWEIQAHRSSRSTTGNRFDIATGQQLFAGQDGNSRALYEPVLQRFRASRRICLDAEDVRAEAGRPRRLRDRRHWKEPARICASRSIRRSSARLIPPTTDRRDLARSRLALPTSSREVR